MTATAGRTPGVLRRLYRIIDGPHPASCVELLSDDLRFSVVFSTGPGAAEDFAGDRPAFDEFPRTPSLKVVKGDVVKLVLERSPVTA